MLRRTMQVGMLKPPNLVILSDGQRRSQLSGRCRPFGRSRRDTESVTAPHSLLASSCQQPTGASLGHTAALATTVRDGRLASGGLFRRICSKKGIGRGMLTPLSRSPLVDG